MQMGISLGSLRSPGLRIIGSRIGAGYLSPQAAASPAREQKRYGASRKSTGG